MLENSSPVPPNPAERLRFACSGAHFEFQGYTSPRPGFNAVHVIRAKMIQEVKVS
jgi:hypothetical protein